MLGIHLSLRRGSAGRKAGEVTATAALVQGGEAEETSNWFQRLEKVVELEWLGTLASYWQA